MRAQSLGAGLLAPSPSSLAPFALHRPGTVAEAVGAQVTELPLSPERVFHAIRAVRG